MEKHYKLLENDTIEIRDVTLYRIQATKDSKYAKKGDLGGYIQGYHNLMDDAWVYHDACVFGNALVRGNSRIYDDACVYENALVYDDARVFQDARVFGNSAISENARVFGNACISGDSRIYGKSHVYHNAIIYGNAWIFGNTHIQSNDDYCVFQNFGSTNRDTTFFKNKKGKVFVKCGCFQGSIERFEQQVKETHGDNKFGKEYLTMIELVKIKFELI